jgi:hypothetical protein
MIFVLAMGSVIVLAAVGAPVILAAGDADDNIAPPGSYQTISSSSTTLVAPITGGPTLTSTCTFSKDIIQTPNTGLTYFSSLRPQFSRCTDSLGGKDTVTVTQTGVWAGRFVDAAGDETATEPNVDSFRLIVPKAGVTITSSAAPTCLFTLSPAAPTVMASSYDDGAHTASFSGAAVPYSISGSGCPFAGATGSSSFSATYTASPGFADAS